MDWLTRYRNNSTRRRQAKEINQNGSSTVNGYYGVLNIDSGEINKLPIKGLSEAGDDIAGWTFENNLLYHSYLESNQSGNQDFIVYSPKGDELKKFNKQMLDKEEIVVISKADNISAKDLKTKADKLSKSIKKPVITLSLYDDKSVKAFEKVLKGKLK